VPDLAFGLLAPECLSLDFDPVELVCLSATRRQRSRPTGRKSSPWLVGAHHA
jgi:hypothetical protein